jgi:hypothetical protein
VVPRLDSQILKVDWLNLQMTMASLSLRLFRLLGADGKGVRRRGMVGGVAVPKLEGPWARGQSSIRGGL